MVEGWDDGGTQLGGGNGGRGVLGQGELASGRGGGVGCSASEPTSTWLLAEVGSEVDRGCPDGGRLNVATVE